MAQTTLIRLESVPHQYPIHVGAGLLDQLPQMIHEVLPQARRVFVITDTQVAPLYLPRVEAALESHDFEVIPAAMDPGEQHKTMATLDGLYQQAMHYSIKRNDMVLALGGGIVGDVAGYFAATILRGIPFVQVPTTLLSQVDASVGGKVAVNYQGLKNWIGAFYHPYAVIIDTDTLKTLPDRDFAGGMAEVIKYSLLELSVPEYTPPFNFFEFLWERNLQEGENLQEVIATCCRIKGLVVQADPKEEKGIREILNLGHTFAHAYETLTQGELSHGEAVAIGMHKAFRLASNMGQIPGHTVDQVMRILMHYHLPIQLNQSYQQERILELMQKDKKSLSDKTFRLVLPVGEIGRVTINSQVDREELEAVV